MGCKTDNFNFDPDKSALENLFALIYRTNRVKLDPSGVDVDLPRVMPTDVHGDNTIIKVTAKENGPFKGSGDLYYARADIDTHYPVFMIDLKDIPYVRSKEALVAYLDGRFNLVDGEFDVDLTDPFTSLATYLSFDIFAKDTSYIYIGNKTIHVFWSDALRRVTEDGRVRITEEGQVRTIENPVNMDDYPWYK